MGWASGSDLMDKIIKSAKKRFSIRRGFYQDIIKAFEEQDCDTLEECKGTDSQFDEVYDELESGRGD